jgi:hypothetical protein
VTRNITVRTTRSWIVLFLRVLACGFLIAALILHGDLRLVPIAIALGCVLVLFVLRDRTQPSAGADWSGSADLLLKGKKFSGQLSLAKGRMIWSPTDRSHRLGVDEINVNIVAGSELKLETGPALLDVIVTVSGTAGKHRFLTHRSSSLKRAVDHLEM